MTPTGHYKPPKPVYRADGLTERQYVVLAAIREWLATHPYPPTVRDLLAATGINHPNGIIVHLTALARKGWITRDPYTARSIVLGPRSLAMVTPTPPEVDRSMVGLPAAFLATLADHLRVMAEAGDREAYRLHRELNQHVLDPASVVVGGAG